MGSREQYTSKILFCSAKRIMIWVVPFYGNIFLCQKPLKVKWISKRLMS
jgi:hypothetical protein